MFLTFIPRKERDPFEKVMATVEDMRRTRFIQTWRFNSEQLGVDVEVYPAASGGVIERGGYDAYIKELKEKLAAVNLDLYVAPKPEPDEPA